MDRTHWIALETSSVPPRCTLMRETTELANSETSDLEALVALLPEGQASPVPILVAGEPGVLGFGAMKRQAPCEPLPDSLQLATTLEPMLWLAPVPGLHCVEPLGLMEGAQVRIAGFMALNPGWDGILCLTGMETVWVEISAGEVVSFLSTMTGELLHRLAGEDSSAGSWQEAGFDDEAFALGLELTRTKPESVMVGLARARARGAVEKAGIDVERSQIEGVLIGAELAAARAYWLGREVAVIGEAREAQPYLAGLLAQGVSAIEVDGSAALRNGMIAAWRLLPEDPEPIDMGEMS